MHLSQEEISRLVQLALNEDVGSGDVTTLSVVPADWPLKVAMVPREPLMVCGTEFARMAFQQLSSEICFESLISDGASALVGDRIAIVEGPAQGILTAERVALNFMQRLSGIATLTQSYVEKIRGLNTLILDTRKTTPGLRRVEKYAVKCGGGKNHRIGLFDMVLIKDNHLAALKHRNIPDPVGYAVRTARANHPNLKVEVEADNLNQVQAAVNARADIILLDNMSLDQLREAVKMTRGECKTEASGGVNLGTVRAIAETGVDYISVGALTHSARAVDIGLDDIIE